MRATARSVSQQTHDLPRTSWKPWKLSFIRKDDFSLPRLSALVSSSKVLTEASIMVTESCVFSRGRRDSCLVYEYGFWIWPLEISVSLAYKKKKKSSQVGWYSVKVTVVGDTDLDDNLISKLEVNKQIVNKLANQLPNLLAHCVVQWLNFLKKLWWVFKIVIYKIINGNMPNTS